jgi:hypothetical protein
MREGPVSIQKRKRNRWLLPAGSIGFIIAVLLIATRFAIKPETFVSGTILVPAEVARQAGEIKIMFITLFDADLPGPPYGAMREPIQIDPEGTERTFFVTREKLQIMNPSRPLPNRLRVKVRLDVDGQGGADQPGDITGEVQDIVTGSSSIEITTDRVVGL